MIDSRREHIQNIRADFQASQRVKDSFNNAIQALAKDLYSKDTHFIFELIQNAEDNAYGAVEPFLSFQLIHNDRNASEGSTDVLIVQNNEVGFSPENVDAICAVGRSTKKKIQGYIGEKGIGFKSVFRVTSNPSIYSNGYRFCLPEHDKESGLGYIVPQWIPELPSNMSNYKTVIILPLDRTDFNYEKIHEMLNDIRPETTLFLSKLKEIKIESDIGNRLTIIKDTHKMPFVQILVEGKREGESVSYVDEFLLCTRVFEKPKEINHEKREGIENREVSIAFPINKNCEKSGRIFAYLPVRSGTGLPFLINADFILPSTREDIQDVSWNRWLMKCAAELVKIALPLLKEKGLLTIDFLEVFTSKLNELAEDKKNMLYPIVTAVYDALMKEDLLPTNDGAFVKAECAKLARGSELRSLLKEEQLRSLFKSNQTIKWLSAEITRDLTPSLRRYIMNQLGVEEIRPEKFVELLTDDFLENQNDRWIIDFYSYFSKEREELWKKPDASLRKKKIIRLEDDSHVVPFKNDGTPNAYLPSLVATKFPTIKKSIFEDEAAADFLKKLGIIEPDLFAGIIEFMLPKYTEDGIVVSYEENIDDLKKIKKLLDEPFQGSSSSSLPKLRILLGKLGLSSLEDACSKVEIGKLIPILLKMVLPSIRFLKASNGRKTEYKSPKDIYKNMPELHDYFQDNPEAWFICDDYPDELLSLFHELGVNERPKVTKRNADNNGSVKISGSHSNHRRGLDGYDPDITVDGFEYAIRNPTTKRSAFIWNTIAVQYMGCIRGVVEKSSKKTYENSKKETHVSKFGRLLSDTAWLPSPNGSFSKPEPLSLNDLTTEFEKDTPRAKALSQLLGMKQPEREHALEVVTGGDPDLKMRLERFLSASDNEQEKMLKIIPRETPSEPAPSFKDGLKKLSRLQRGVIEHNENESHPVGNPERYQEKLYKQVGKGIEEHRSTIRKITFSPLRDSPSNVEARQFLYEQYNGRCQITGITFPKASRNSDGKAENYFEACSLLSYVNADYLNDAGNMLCVSADTMAKFKHASVEFLEGLDNVIEIFKKNGSLAESVSVKIRLAGEESSIKWSQRHFMRLVALYEKA